MLALLLIGMLMLASSIQLVKAFFDCVILRIDGISLCRKGISIETDNIVADGTDILIGDFYSCDKFGNPQYYFPRRTTAYFNISVTNLAHEPKNVFMYLSAQDELDVAIGLDQLNTTTPPNISTYYIMSIFVPNWAYVGTATAYISVLVGGAPVDSDLTELYIGPVDLTPPVIHLLFPENVTYNVESVPLIFTVNERTTWVGYNLNNLGNVSITGNTTLISLPNGSYGVKVYANDTSGNMGFSEKVYFTILVIHDLAVTDLICSSTKVYVGQIINITVFVQNEGNVPETFNVTTYTNTTATETLTVTNLLPGNQTTLAFTWNTSDFARGNYTIKAMASTVPGEVDISDNTFIDGNILVAVFGDLNNDGIVDMGDLSIVGRAFGSYPGHPRWNPNTDLNDDDFIDMGDLGIVGRNFGQIDP
jgi:hypothetical protein